MTQLLAATLGGLLIALGAIGCVVPVIPGPVIAYAALWVPYAMGLPVDWAHIGVGTAVLAAITVADYVLPAVVARKFKCSKAGVTGCLVGTFAGLFFMPLGILLGPFAGTVLGELVVGKGLASSLKGGFGAFVGFVLCLIGKFAVVAIFAYWFASSLSMAVPE